ARAEPTSASTILKMTRTAEIAARIGLRSKKMPSNIFLGRVVVSTLLRNIAITTSSKEITNAKIAPAAIPLQISGIVMSHSEVSGEPPRLNEASSYDGGRAASAELALRITNGRQRTA